MIDMEDVSPKQLIQMVMDILETMYGNLGFLAFRLHSIKPNSKECVYVIKYSFVPRSQDNKRMYYEAKINVQNKNIFEINEIRETELQ